MTTSLAWCTKCTWGNHTLASEYLSLQLFLSFSSFYSFPFWFIFFFLFHTLASKHFIYNYHVSFIKLSESFVTHRLCLLTLGHAPTRVCWVFLFFCDIFLYQYPWPEHLLHHATLVFFHCLFTTWASPPKRRKFHPPNVDVK